MPHPRVWAPEDPQVKKVKIMEEEQNPQNTPIKGYVQPVYSHNWIGYGDYHHKSRRVLFHPVPVTPTKITEGKKY